MVKFAPLENSRFYFYANFKLISIFFQQITANFTDDSTSSEERPLHVFERARLPSPSSFSSTPTPIATSSRVDLGDATLDVTLDDVFVSAAGGDGVINPGFIGDVLEDEEELDEAAEVVIYEKEKTVKFRPPPPPRST